MIAQTMRAILLTSATLTSIGGLWASILASHVPGVASVRHTSSLLTPMIRSRRRDRSPIFVVDPSRLLAARRMLSRHKPEPRGKVASTFESFRRWRKRHQCGGNQRTNSGDCHQSACSLTFTSPAHDLHIQHPDLIIQLRQNCGQNRKAVRAVSGSAVCGSSTIAISLLA